MATHLTVAADLEFSVDLPGSPALSGSLSGAGQALELHVSDPSAFAGRTDSPAIRNLAQLLADRGLMVRVVTPAGPLATLGDARTVWWQRLVTRSPHIRLERGAALWSVVRDRLLSRGGGAVPTPGLTPPSTPYPVAPTMVRRPRTVTTTHDPFRGGNPRLALPVGPPPRVGDRPTVFRLRDDVTTIGSDASCDIRFPGLEGVHVEIRHNDDDDFVLTRVAGAGIVRVHGAPTDLAVLRTGCLIDLGDCKLVYARDEYADHGRLYGGRIGGELGHQRTQPSREWQRQQVEGPP